MENFCDHDWLLVDSYDKDAGLECQKCGERIEYTDPEN